MSRAYRPLTVNSALTWRLRNIQARVVDSDEARKALGELLQSALELEFATVPTYLAAAFSLTTSNARIRSLILRVAQEEMLHMTAVANMMNAIGVMPRIDAAVPDFPYDLTVLEPALRLDLRSFSLELVEDLFMRIEAPEQPNHFPMGVAERPTTIGQFYQSIIEIIKNDVIPGLFDNASRDAYKQVRAVPNFPRFAYVDEADNQKYPLESEIDFLITDKASAIRHLEWIVDQGEGTEPLIPLTAEGLPGHYYRFESILRSRYLVPDSEVELDHSFSGASLPFDPAGVHEFAPNPKVSDYAAHAEVAEQMVAFNANYTGMINALNAAFNCPDPSRVAEAGAAYELAIGNMQDMPGVVRRLIAKAKAANVAAGVPFEYGGP